VSLFQPPEIPVPESIYSFSRALVLGIIVSSEALLARRRRVGFERHLVLFSAFTLIMAAEVWSVFLAISEQANLFWRPCGVWVWPAALSSIGLLGVAMCFDFVRPGRKVRASSRRYILLAALLLASGTLLSAERFSSVGPPTSYVHMGRVAFVLHGIQAAAMLAVGFKAFVTRGAWLSHRESRVFLLGCLAGMMGAAWQILAGPSEHLTTLAYTVFVAVFLRDNYRRTELDAVRASEDLTAKTLTFHRITTQLKSTFDLSELYTILMDSLTANLGAESGAIYIRESRQGELRPVLIQGAYPPPLPLSDWPADDPQARREALLRTNVPLGEGVVGRVAQTGTPLYIYDPDEAARVYAWPTDPIRVHTSVALPLRSPESVYGVVQLVNRLDGSTFGEEDLRFMSLVVEQAGLAIYNARLHAEIVARQRTEEQLKIARQIQLRLIPSELPQIPGLSIGAEYLAAQEVGGDYFDFYRIDHDHLGVLVLDVAGKGVPGALLMAMTATFLKMAAPRSQSPAWVLNEVNAALSAELRRGMFVTAIYGVLRLSTHELTLCCAGHPDAIIVRGEDLRCERRKPRGAALGLLRPNRFRAVLEQETIPLRTGDTLLLYTDGVTEAMNEAGEEFGEDRLCSVAHAHAGEGPQRLAAEVVTAVRRHTGAAPQYDDITVIALRMDSTPESAQGRWP